MPPEMGDHKEVAERLKGSKSNLTLPYPAP